MADRNQIDRTSPSTDRLLQQYVSGEITQEEGDILFDRMEASPELGHRLFQQMETDVLLETVIGEDASFHGKSNRLSDGTSVSRRRRFLRRSVFWGIPISVCVLILAVILFRNSGPRDFPVGKTGDETIQAIEQPANQTTTVLDDSPEPTTTAVAILSGAADAVWDERAGMFRQGQAVEPGWLRLRSGLVAISFFNGAEVVMAGPAELEIVSVDRIQCRFGSINVNVPPQARGFFVTSPQMSVRDLGTAFSVSVTNRGTEVHVIKGEIELHDLPFDLENLKEGDAVFVASQGTYHRFEANDETFAPTRSLKDKTKEYLTLQYKKWQARKSRFDDDPFLALRFDFENLTVQSESVPNAVTVPVSNVADGRMIGCRWAEGRWPGKGAVEFSRTSDRIRLRIPEANESITLSAWIRVNSLSRRSSALFVTQPGQDKAFPTSSLEWSILESGALRLKLGTPLPEEVLQYDSPPYFKPEHLGQWTHVAVVIDGMTQTVMHFVNGMLIGAPHVDLPFKESLPIGIGISEIGNVPAVSSNKKGAPIRNLCGCIDEFHLFRRALSREEIWDLYDPVPDWLAVPESP